MKQRVFIALTLSKKLQNKVESWKKNLQNLPVRWIKGKNLHITLIPPWYVEDPEKIIPLLKRVKDIKHFKVEFKKVTFGPTKYKPRLVWANGQRKDEITHLKSELEKILGQKGEKREFLLHMTLARFKPQEFGNFPVQNINENIVWSETFGSFCFMRSYIKKGGADYEIIRKFKF